MNHNRIVDLIKKISDLHMMTMIPLERMDHPILRRVSALHISTLFIYDFNQLSCFISDVN